MKTNAFILTAESKDLWDRNVYILHLLKGTKAVLHHLLAGTYRQFSAPFWQLWKISNRAGKQAKQKQKQSKDDNSRKIHGNQRINTNHNVDFKHACVLNNMGKLNFTKEYAFCKWNDKKKKDD